MNTTEVPFTSPMISLNAFGTMARAACGSVMRKKRMRRGRPSAPAASSWPWSTERMPARMISAE